MRQKYSVTIADVPMNIVCEENQETVDAAVAEVDGQIRALIASVGHGCTRTEAALLCALDAKTQNGHLKERVAELESFVGSSDPTGENFGAALLRGENEALRAQLEAMRGEYEALLEDNATLFGINAKLARQSNESNSRADRMHDQVLSILTEVRELREKLAAMCVDPKIPTGSYSAVMDEEPRVTFTQKEREVGNKYEQLNIDSILASLPQKTGDR